MTGVSSLSFIAHSHDILAPATVFFIVKDPCLQSECETEEEFSSSLICVPPAGLLLALQNTLGRSYFYTALQLRIRLKLHLHIDQSAACFHLMNVYCPVRGHCVSDASASGMPFIH